MDRLHPAEHDLANLAALARHDGYLDLFAGQAEAGAGAVVGVLANGMTIYGRLAPNKAMAERFDRFIAGVFGRAEAHTDDPEGLAASRDKVLGKAVEAAEQRASERRDLVLSGDDSADQDVERPAEEVRKEVGLFTHPVLTLTEAKVMIPGQQQSVEVPVLRLHVGQIAAWWLLEEREDGSVPIQHPTP